MCVCVCARVRVCVCVSVCLWRWGGEWEDGVGGVSGEGLPSPRKETQ